MNNRLQTRFYDNYIFMATGYLQWMTVGPVFHLLISRTFLLNESKAVAFWGTPLSGHAVKWKRRTRRDIFSLVSYNNNWHVRFSFIVTFHINCELKIRQFSIEWIPCNHYQGGSHGQCTYLARSDSVKFNLLDRLAEGVKREPMYNKILLTNLW